MAILKTKLSKIPMKVVGKNDVKANAADKVNTDVKLIDEEGKEIVVDDNTVELTEKNISIRKPADAELPPQPKPETK